MFSGVLWLVSKLFTVCCVGCCDWSVGCLQCVLWGAVIGQSAVYSVLCGVLWLVSQLFTVWCLGCCDWSVGCLQCVVWGAVIGQLAVYSVLCGMLWLVSQLFTVCCVGCCDWSVGCLPWAPPHQIPCPRGPRPEHWPGSPAGCSPPRRAASETRMKWCSILYTACTLLLPTDIMGISIAYLVECCILLIQMMLKA